MKCGHENIYTKHEQNPSLNGIFSNKIPDFTKMRFRNYRDHFLLFFLHFY